MLYRITLLHSYEAVLIFSMMYHQPAIEQLPTFKDLICPTHQLQINLESLSSCNRSRARNGKAWKIQRLCFNVLNHVTWLRSLLQPSRENTGSAAKNYVTVLNCFKREHMFLLHIAILSDLIQNTLTYKHRIWYQRLSLWTYIIRLYGSEVDGSSLLKKKKTFHIKCVIISLTFFTLILL